MWAYRRKHWPLEASSGTTPITCRTCLFTDVLKSCNAGALQEGPSLVPRLNPSLKRRSGRRRCDGQRGEDSLGPIRFGQASVSGDVGCARKKQRLQLSRIWQHWPLIDLCAGGWGGGTNHCEGERRGVPGSFKPMNYILLCLSSTSAFMHMCLYSKL